MNRVSFAFKRSLRSPGFLLVLLLCAFAVYLASLSGAAGSPPPAGVCDLGGSEESRRMVSYLTDNGYRLIKDAETLEQMVERGELDCGITLPEDLAQRIRSGDLEQAIRFVSAPSSFAPELYRNLAVAALFREHAPYVAAEAFADTVLTQEQVVERYFAMFEEGYAFAFDLVLADGAALPVNARSEALVMGAVAILLLAVLLAGSNDLMNVGFHDMSRRLGFTSAMKDILLPALAVRSLLAGAMVSLALLAAALVGGSEYCLRLIPAALIYSLLLPTVGMLLAALLPGKRQMYVLLPLLLIASLALCPIFTDLTLLSPALGAVRCLLPSFWFWLIAERPLLWLLIVLAAVPSAVLAMALRGCVFGKYRVHGEPCMEKRR